MEADVLLLYGKHHFEYPSGTWSSIRGLPKHYQQVGGYRCVVHGTCRSTYRTSVRRVRHPARMSCFSPVNAPFRGLLIGPKPLARL